jgi:hypothetical protein
VGRTQPTFRNLVDRLYVDWGEYRRALRGAEKEAFDALFRKAKNHASAAQLVTEPDPLRAAMMGMLLEHELELARLRRRLALRGEEPEEEAEEEGEDPG